jgi:hypothetical protein
MRTDTTTLEASAQASERETIGLLVGVVDHLSVAPPELGEAAEAAEEAHRAVVEYLLRWRRLDPASSVRAAIDAVRRAADAAVEALAAAASMSAAETVLAEDLLELATETGRWSIASALRDATADQSPSLREVGRRSSSAASYLSELANLKSGFPSEARTDAIAAVVGDEFRDLVQNARAQVAAARSAWQTARDRGAGTAVMPASAQPGMRLTALTTRLSADDELLTTVELLARLPRATRSSVRRLLADLIEQLPLDSTVSY